MEVCGASTLTWSKSISPTLSISQPKSVSLFSPLFRIPNHILCSSQHAHLHFPSTQDSRRKGRSAAALLRGCSCLFVIGAPGRPSSFWSSSLLKKENQMIVSITGATGFIGQRLVRKLYADNHLVRVLTRSKSKARKIFPDKDFPGIVVADESEWKNCIQGSSAVVNLAGLPISTRWSPEIKKEIKQSRISVTSKVVDYINNAQDGARPTVLVSATAVGYYGTSETKVFDEQSPSGNDYLAEVCRDWEGSALKVNKDVRLALVRIGVVLGKDGGALAKMIPLFKMFAGGRLGSGNQWFSWIHLDDIVSLIYETLSNPSYKGVINGTAPNPVRLREMCESLGSVMGRPSWLPVPGFALKAVLGEGATVVLEGQRVLPVRAKELGFKFKYPFIKEALKDILSAEKVAV